MPELESNGVRLFYEEDGAGEPVVLVNGLIMTTKHWAPQLELASRFRLIRYDQRNQGRSTVDQGFRYTALVDDLLGLLDHLGVERAAVGGISFGSIVAKELAVRYPDRCRALALISPLGRMDPNLLCVYSVWRALLKAGAMRAFAASVTMLSYDWPWPEAVAASLEPALDWYETNGVPAQALGLLDSFEERDLQNVSEITVPTLVIGAQRDRIHAPDDARWIAEQIPNARLCMLDGSHAITIDQPARVNQELLDFFGG